MELPLLSAAASHDAERLHLDPGLRRVRRGLYAAADGVDALARWDRYLLDVRAVAASRPGAVLARESALALAGLPFGAPDDVFTIGDPATPGVRHGVRNSHVAVAAEDLELDDGILRCSTPYALADLARRGRQSDAVAAVDAALRRDDTTLEGIADALERQGPRGQRRARWVLGFADPRSESVGESWSRVVIHRIGAPAPDLQRRVPTALGDRWLDFCFDLPGRRPVAGEFDGLMKYGAIATAEGRDPAAVVMEEQRREDAIRVTHDMARWIWDDVLHPMRLSRILAAAGVPVAAMLLPGW